MRAPDVGSAAIADIFVCRPEHALLVIGQIKRRRAVIADPEISGEKAASRSRHRRDEFAEPVERGNPHRQLGNTIKSTHF